MFQLSIVLNFVSYEFLNKFFGRGCKFEFIEISTRTYRFVLSIYEVLLPHKTVLHSLHLEPFAYIHRGNAIAQLPNRPTT